MGFDYRRRIRQFLGIISQIWLLRKPLVPYIIICSALPLPMSIGTPEAKTAYVLIVMAVLWLTESIPIPVTSLLPIILLPALGVATAAQVSQNYIKDTSMLFMGGLMVAVAVEEWNLHKRIALSVLRLVGSDPKWIMAGLMLPTWFLSMWISNTATTSMMLPIVEAVLIEMKLAGSRKAEMAAVNEGFSMGSLESDSTEQGSKPNLNPNGMRLTTGKSSDDGKQSSQNSSTVDFSNITKSSRCSSDVKLVSEISRSSSMSDEDDEYHKEYVRTCKGLSLCIAYAANVGGIATLTGSPPNLVFKGQADVLFEKYHGDSGVNFANFMLVSLPLSAMMLVLCWSWLFVFFIRFKGCCQKNDTRRAALAKAIQTQFRSLGRITFAEIVILLLFALFAALLLTRKGENYDGWGSLFPAGYVKDSSSAMFVAVLLFIIPAKRPKVFCWRYSNDRKENPEYIPLLTWEKVHAKLPWGVIILLGGGFAIADACKTSGLSEWVGERLKSFSEIDPLVSCFLLILITAFVTEVTSNTATATLLMPIMAELALKTNVNPLYLMMSAAMATSFAFMLPVATPPNAIVFSNGHLQIFDMALCGFVMNIIAVACLTLCMNTWAYDVYDLGTVPSIFNTSLTATTPKP